MNMKIWQGKFTIGAPLSAVAVSALLLAGGITSAHAGHGYGHQGSGLGSILGGAAVGAIIGGAVKGGKGAAVGAGIGAAVGAASSSRAAPPPPPPRPYYPPRPVYTNGLVYNIQVSLSRLGYNPGPLDGAYGQRTADAISSYEYNNQLAVTGRPSDGLYYHMKQAGG